MDDNQTPNVAISGSQMPFISWVVFRAKWVIIALTLFTLYPAPACSQTVATAPANPVQSNEAIINADQNGHFRGTVLINNVAMPFLIDTGATKTIIPGKLAASAKLSYGRYIQASTAGGKVSQRETTIKTLELGPIKIQNLDASINDHLDVVLIGMNALKHVSMSQNGNTLTLVANDQSTLNDEAVHSGPEPSGQRMQKTTAIKKTVICDDRKVCTTKYSDH